MWHPRQINLYCGGLNDLAADLVAVSNHSFTVRIQRIHRMPTFVFCRIYLNIASIKRASLCADQQATISYMHMYRYILLVCISMMSISVRISRLSRRVAAITDLRSSATALGEGSAAPSVPRAFCRCMIFLLYLVCSEQCSVGTTRLRLQRFIFCLWSLGQPL